MIKTAVNRYLGVFLVLVICQSSGIIYAAERTDLATLVSVFDQMALRDQGRVIKWKPANRQLTIQVTAKFGERESGVLTQSLEVLGAHANLRIFRNDDAQKPDLVVETAKTLKPHPGVGQRYIGFTDSIWGRLESEMRTATIQIAEDWYRNNPYAIHRTIPHELMHALGFHGHAQVFDSALSLQNTRNSLSEWDLFFTRVLYDPRLPVGTPRSFALPLVCNLIHERLIAEGNLDVTDLNRAGAHSYCEQLLTNQQIIAKTPSEEIRLSWAYLHGLGVAKNIPEAERWAQRAFAAKNPDAQKVIQQIEKTKQAAPTASHSALATALPGTFKPAAEGTTFILSSKDSLKIVRIEGSTVHTVTSKNAAYRWAGLFFGRAERIPTSESEVRAANIWPLTVGKKIDFEHTSNEAGQSVVWRNHIEVLRIEILKIEGKEVATYVVERRVTQVSPPGIGDSYEGIYTFWYSPEFGFHMRYRSQFTGATTDRPTAWSVTQIAPPTASR